MKKCLILSIFVFSMHFLFTQSKKEVLEIINKKIDSLSTEISNQKQQNIALQRKINQISDSLTLLNNELSACKNSDTILRSEFDSKNRSNENATNAFLDYVYTNYSEKSSWTELIKGNDKVQSFEFTKDNELKYLGNVIKGIRHYENATKIEVSQHEYRNDYELCLTYDNDNDQVLLYLLDLKTYQAFEINIIHYPLSWYSWSPDRTFVILGRYDEGDMELFCLNIETKKLFKLDLYGDLRPGAAIYEHEIVFEVEKLIWISPTVIRIITHTNNFNTDTEEILRVKEFTFVYYYDIIQNKILLRYKF